MGLVPRTLSSLSRLAPGLRHFRPCCGAVGRLHCAGVVLHGELWERGHAQEEWRETMKSVLAGAVFRFHVGLVKHTCREQSAHRKMPANTRYLTKCCDWCFPNAGSDMAVFHRQCTKYFDRVLRGRGSGGGVKSRQKASNVYCCSALLSNTLAGSTCTTQVCCTASKNQHTTLKQSRRNAAPVHTVQNSHTDTYNISKVTSTNARCTGLKRLNTAKKYICQKQLVVARAQSSWAKMPMPMHMII